MLMKLFHNKFIARLLGLIVGVACAMYFGWTFSFFGYWIGGKFQGFLPESPAGIALVCWVVMSLLVVFSFFYAEYVKEDIQAYEDDKGDGSFERAFKQLKWGVLCLEIASLLFRWFQLNFAPIGIAMILAGVVLLWLAHLFGKILHAQANVPYDVEAGRVMRAAGEKAWNITRRGLRRVKDPDQLHRIAGGDFKPLREVKDVQEQERQGQKTREQQRREENQAQRERQRQAAEQHMKPRDDVPFLAAQSSQADHLSQSNGRH